MLEKGDIVSLWGITPPGRIERFHLDGETVEVVYLDKPQWHYCAHVSNLRQCSKDERCHA